MISTSCPQCCVLSPLFYTLYTCDCVASQNNTSIIKFADDTTVIGLITRGVETDYKAEVAGLKAWCKENNLSLNTDKSKEMIIDPSKRRVQHLPVYQGGEGKNITDQLTWSHNTKQLFKSALYSQ